MSRITDSRTLFFVTSPRTPDKMINEVKLLVDQFSGQPWNSTIQERYYRALVEEDFFRGNLGGDIAFQARDRINRSPKALGIVDLSPKVRLTEVGKRYLYGPHSEEAFTKQLLKFQLPSPFHVDKDGNFNVRPYLELIHLIRDLNGMTKTEIAIFGLQLTSYQKYDHILSKIKQFRAETKQRNRNISYKVYIQQVFEREVSEVYAAEITQEKFATRESEDASLKKFIATKMNNQKDYADAAFRYLRATLLFEFHPYKNKLSIYDDKKAEVDYICENIERKPSAFADEESYKEYLFDPSSIQLLTDDRELLLERISKLNTKEAARLQGAGIEQLKDIYDRLQEAKLEERQKSEISALQTYDHYDDISKVYADIRSKNIVDPPLFLEWNTWRAFTMLNDGKIIGNFKIDDEGLPLYTAAGNAPDIECQYKDFRTIVEVTMSTGAKQYEMEGEPVARHLGNIARETDEDVYCIFIAPKISPATLAHYYVLHDKPVAYYGGKAKIIPVQLDAFEVMLRNAKQAVRKPTSTDLRGFLERTSKYAQEAEDEIDWLEKINNEARSAFI